MKESKDNPANHLGGCDEDSRSAKLRALGREQHLRAQLDDVRDQLDSILSSRSWKLTQPWRDATGWVRQRRGGAKKEEPFRPIRSPEDDKGLPGHATADIGGEHFLTQGRGAWDQAGSAHLAALLRSRTRLSIPRAVECEVSIIVAFYNKAHLGLLCIEAILENADVPYELILVDNGSTDNTKEMLDRLDGAEIIRNQKNLGFGLACTQGAEKARGEYLCFLNNDALLQPRSLNAVSADFREDSSIGAVGGKILLADGHLQEAGSIVWNDGSAWGYGRGDDPRLPRYEFRRPVDYCSGAFLFTPRSLFNELGGFDARFLPAYYEDIDYCFKVWNKGLRVIYEPRAVIRHYESASSETTETAKGPILENRAKFVDKWRLQLEQHLPPAGEHVPYARIAVQAGGARILYLKDPACQSVYDSTSIRPDAVVAQLVNEGHHITVASTSPAVDESHDRSSSTDIEYVDATTAAHYLFRELLSQYDAVWINGQQSMRSLLLHIRDMGGRIPAIIYEAGVLPVEREALEAQVADGVTGSIGDAIRSCDAADIVFAKSEVDRQFLTDKGIRNICVLSPDSITAVAARVARNTQAARSS